MEVIAGDFMGISDLSEIFPYEAFGDFIALY